MGLNKVPNKGPSNLQMDIIIVIIYMTFKILINKMLVKQNTIKDFQHQKKMI